MLDTLIRDNPSEGAHYDRFAALVRAEIGVKLPPNKRLMVESRLRRRMATCGFTSLERYFVHLFEEGGLESERDAIFDAVTTNKTDFFREPAHFRYLADHIVPAFRASGRRRFKLWSAAASNGAEAWSAAMVLATCADAGAWAVLGTDINTVVLSEARRAVYPTEEVAYVPAALRERFVMEGRGEMAGECRIHPDLRARVRFARLNLLAPTYPVDPDVDAIFLRNVLIYFDPGDQDRVIGHLRDHLAPGGYLLVGHSESMVVRVSGLTQVAPAIYRKN